MKWDHCIIVGLSSEERKCWERLTVVPLSLLSVLWCPGLRWTPPSKVKNTCRQLLTSLEWVFNMSTPLKHYWHSYAYMMILCFKRYEVTACTFAQNIAHYLVLNSFIKIHVQGIYCNFMGWLKKVFCLF